MDQSYFQRLARYNAWANRRLYDACGRLSRADYVAPRSGFFGSIQKTLNHILVADRIWLGRFTGRPVANAALDRILFDDFDELRTARSAEDRRILDLVGGYGDSDLQVTLDYRNVSGQPKSTPFVWALAHFFNHQTHHRGQVHAMLAGTAIAPPPLDLLYFLPEDAG